ncbi:hypothetical protein PSECIP111951_03508 [Pseudoalteromonas holothuriae]|uniref:SPOR domain-containing protein n=2 Tax=Pseudoalteromonas holothuriae TaxID=2963714 RepID=A0A9W4R3W4_9GAMM|nr:hypothetical protein PSECIP111854_03794 [Pseudoalteromonas sp. CIP111854]CAH9066133.1 hypothetical protein PSECIP111951_03508 [Pseudoalteromonas sp. CIP111951]
MLKINCQIWQFAMMLFIVGVSSACTSTKDTEEQEVTLTRTQLEQLQESARQWQEAKDGIARLLRIEKDLSILITQLDSLVKQQINSGNDRKSSYASDHSLKKVIKVTAAKQIENVPQMTSDKLASLPKVTPKYALQLSAVTQKSRLDNLIPNLKSKLPDTLSENLNIETTQIDNVTFYRLKAGGYSDKKLALEACNNLKLKSINCIVSLSSDQTAKTKL